MKPRHASRARALTLMFLLLLGVLLVAIAACQPHRRARAPFPRSAPGSPTACTTDADCDGVGCVIELGAEQGTCGAPSQPPILGDDAGGPLAPAPRLQPSPSDVHL